MQTDDPSTPESGSSPPEARDLSLHIPTGSQRRSSVRVLVIDDEPEIWRAVRAGLANVGFTTEWAQTGTEGMEQVARWHPDVVILDLTLPDIDGIEVCRRLRSWTEIPILVLSVRESEADKVTALQLGADDYLTKPFSMAELTVRVRVALRHATHASGSSDRQARFQTGGLVIDFERRQVSVDGKEIHLTPTEYDLLKYLALNADRVLTHRAILRAVWGPPYEQEVHYLRVFFNQLRRKLEPDPSRPRYLQTELGIGYRLRSTTGPS